MLKIKIKNLWLRIGFAVLGVLVITFCFFQFFPMLVFASQEDTNNVDIETIAKNFVNLCNKGEFKKAVELFDEGMITALPAEELKKTWNDVISQLGEFREIERTRVEEVKEGKIIYVTSNFKQAKADIKIVFDNETKISGLWFTVAPGFKNIHIATVITTVLSLLLIGGFLYRKSPREEWTILALIILLEIPMCALAFNFIRLPIDNWLQNLFDSSSGIYKFLTTLYAPLTEEPAKLWILLIPWFRKYFKKIDAKAFVRAAIAIGLGFGIGEIWLVANFIANDISLALTPWYLLGGFITERIMVIILHSAFTAVAIYFLRKSLKYFIFGILGAMLLHYLVNLPIAIITFITGAPPYKNLIWQILLSVWVLFYLCVMILLLSYFWKGKLQISSIEIRRLFLGEAQCPECKINYVRPFLTFNMVTRSYERCPYCKKWHWVKPHW